MIQRRDEVTDVGFQPDGETQESLRGGVELVGLIPMDGVARYPGALGERVQRKLLAHSEALKLDSERACVNVRIGLRCGSGHPSSIGFPRTQVINVYVDKSTYW